MRLRDLLDIFQTDSSDAKTASASSRTITRVSQVTTSTPLIGSTLLPTDTETIGSQIDLSRFHYSPIRRHDLGSRDCEIRLLTIHPGRWNDEIKCSLHVVNLFNCRAYEALSYASGDPLPTYDILLNEKAFSVARNLGRALHSLRSTTEPRTLWIDAICIDQNDLGEQGSQVMIMRNIFSRAHRVVVWLGGHDEPADHLPQGLLWEWMRREKPLEVPRPPAGTRQTTLEAKACILRAQSFEREGRVIHDLSELLVEIPLRERIAIYRLLARPFFRRLRILQEVAVATEVVAMVGTETFNWNSLITAATYMRIGGRYGGYAGIVGTIQQRVMRAKPEPPKLMLTSVHTWDAIHGATLTKQQYIGTTKIFELMEYAHEFEISDERDRVVALIGISKERDVLDFRPDYSQTLDEFFANFMRKYVQAHQREGWDPIRYNSIWNVMQMLSRDAKGIAWKSGCISHFNHRVEEHLNLSMWRNRYFYPDIALSPADCSDPGCRREHYKPLEPSRYRRSKQKDLDKMLLTWDGLKMVKLPSQVIKQITGIGSRFPIRRKPLEIDAALMKEAPRGILYETRKYWGTWRQIRHPLRRRRLDKHLKRRLLELDLDDMTYC